MNLRVLALTTLIRIEINWNHESVALPQNGKENWFVASRLDNYVLLDGPLFPLHA